MQADAEPKLHSRRNESARGAPVARFTARVGPCQSPGMIRARKTEEGPPVCHPAVPAHTVCAMDVRPGCRSTRHPRVAPARVLLFEPDHEIDDLLRDLGPPRILAVLAAIVFLGDESASRVGMQRLAPLQESVSACLSPNRTCMFPSIRLSMRNDRHGWELSSVPSQVSPEVGRV